MTRLALAVLAIVVAVSVAEAGVTRLEITRREPFVAHLEVYGSRWVSRSSKPLRGGPRRRGWVRLPYASATEFKLVDAARWELHRHLTSNSMWLPCNIAYNIHKER